ncbi:phosphatidylcholine-sterol O-acyltransferase-like protein [Hirsutella rhossiliensis]|uniref:Phosphatidylcholine-sterol O-acyltransferase-like protein n=1 Tax=Hirsutella rhossiliensis TaxID=111463 RepID=A0A9P8MQU2_9HYPO|nr:phosphatidylcholine-sterol O-acyltransferase-like protein [Hirsutella rhossiliensis]KAH0960583.1 phosphatidylcholine-sterol O-acyltransferase-like protein [Hirsutella rhossiliensis]
MDTTNPSAQTGPQRNGSSGSQSQTQEEPQPQSRDAVDLEDDDSIFEDQDGAQAALQPAMSSAASHLTSSLTPAAEKAAVLERVPGGGFFDGATAETEAEEDAESDADPLSSDVSTPRRPEHLQVPSPWLSRPRDPVNDKNARYPQTRDFLGYAFDPARRRRSRSAGQEALKRLQKAFPSIAMPTHLLPSLPTSFFSNFTGDHKQSQNSNSNFKPAAIRETPSPTPLPDAQESARQAHEEPIVGPRLSGSPSPARTSRRPAPLRRVTSDDSMLYHSLSRASSLGDDERFQDVREMVNIRFMALKDSLPDVPNFKMPSLPRFQTPARMSSISLNNFFSSFSDDGVASPSRANDGEFPGSAGAPAPKANAATAFDRVLEELTGDIVLLGGYRGSVLRSAEPPHHQLWAPVKLGFNMRKANLEVGLEDEDEETMEERIVPSGMLKHIGPIDISRKLFKRLRACQHARSGKLRVWDYGYDWRLSPALSSRKLMEFLATLPSNQPGVDPESRGATVIAHSLGGLITRHAVNQRPDLFAGVLYAGVPQRCINILGPFRNGDVVLFNEKLLTAQVNFSIRTSFVLLPDDGFCFVDKETGEEYPVDFLNADDWIKWRLSPCVGSVLPPHIRDRQQSSSPLSSLFPNSLLKGNRLEKKTTEALDNARGQERRVAQWGIATGAAAHKDRTIAPQLGTETHAGSASSPAPPEREQYVNYLRRTLAATRKFRQELAHLPTYESSNSYPPHAVLYGKSIPTVYAAQVLGRDGIACADAYDDLLFRPGDGVVLAREAMLPEGYALVRAGRVSTERGHLTMLGDLPAVGQALEALLKGRMKGIGLGRGESGKAAAC